MVNYLQVTHQDYDGIKLILIVCCF